jgi:hypothetical protein
MLLAVPSTLHDRSAASVSYSVGLRRSDLFVRPEIDVLVRPLIYFSKMDIYLHQLYTFLALLLCLILWVCVAVIYLSLQ